MPATPVWLAMVENLLNRGIRGSMRAGELAQGLDGKALQLRVVGLISVHAEVRGGRIALTAEEGASAAIIAGSPRALLRLVRAGSPQAAASGAAAQISGDAEVANAYRQLFSAARPDWEEELAQRFGDLPARGIFRLGERTLRWLGAVRRTAGENLAEYLQEESRDLVGKHELAEFLRDVDAVREAVDRVAARLTLLERRFAERV